jgi:hypothetical protein
VVVHLPTKHEALSPVSRKKKKKKGRKKERHKRKERKVDGYL